MLKINLSQEDYSSEFSILLNFAGDLLKCSFKNTAEKRYMSEVVSSLGMDDLPLYGVLWLACSDFMVIPSERGDRRFEFKKYFYQAYYSGYLPFLTDCEFFKILEMREEKSCSVMLSVKKRGYRAASVVRGFVSQETEAYPIVKEEDELLYTKAYYSMMIMSCMWNVELLTSADLFYSLEGNYGLPKNYAIDLLKSRYEKIHHVSIAVGKFSDSMGNK